MSSEGESLGFLTTCWKELEGMFELSGDFTEEGSTDYKLASTRFTGAGSIGLNIPSAIRSG
jgi:hypothetical protein